MNQMKLYSKVNMIYYYILVELTLCNPMWIWKYNNDVKDLVKHSSL